MTVTEAEAQVQVNGTEAGEATNEQPAKRGRSADRDFTKIRPYHQELANYINEHSGLEPVTPNQVKAMLALRTDYGNTPEAEALRAQRKAEKDAEAERFKGLTEDEIKSIKAADRAAKSLERLQEKAAAALARAEELRNANAGSGEDLQTVVQSSQNTVDFSEGDSPEGEERPRRGLGRRR